MQRKLASIFILIAVAAAMMPLSVFGASNADVQAQIDAITKQQAALLEEQKQLESKLDATAAQKQTLQNAINTLNLSKQKLQNDLKITTSNITSANLQIQKISSNIDSNQASIAIHEAGIADALKQLAAYDGYPLALQMLSSDSLSEVWTDVESLKSAEDSLGSEKAALEDAQTSLATNKSAKETQKSNLVSQQAQLAAQKQVIQNEQDTKTVLLNQTKNQESLYQTLLAQKKAQEAQFEADIFSLSEQLKSANTNEVPSPVHSILAWPLNSIRITQPFGKTGDSGRLYTSGTHNGVDFAASTGTSVHAVMGGTVMATNYITPSQDKQIGYCQYGSWVLIKHPDGLASLYAHLSQVNVAKGQEVSTGQIIGYSGQTGYATGPHLHLTLYNASSIAFENYSCSTGYKVYIPITPINGYLDPMAYLPVLK